MGVIGNYTALFIIDVIVAKSVLKNLMFSS